MSRYGRCMSKQEAKKLRRTSELYDHGSGLVPVFDSPKTVEDGLKGMNKDQLRNYFRRIGVRSPQTVVFFEVNDSIDGIIGPIPQKNGLREYKIPEGTKVDVYGSVRL